MLTSFRTPSPPKDGICHLVWAPAQINGLVASKAKHIAEQAIATLEGAGIYGVEMFELPDGDIIINEIAPRPHNSGHYTQDANHTSQFEQHLRCILGLPLGSTDMKVPAAAMVNILGTGSGEEGLRDTLLPCAANSLVNGTHFSAYSSRLFAAPPPNDLTAAGMSAGVLTTALPLPS